MAAKKANTSSEDMVEELQIEEADDDTPVINLLNTFDRESGEYQRQ